MKAKMASLGKGGKMQGKKYIDVPLPIMVLFVVFTV
jgi:hypothetical protein